MQVLLPAIQANYAMVQGDVLARASAEWMQHMTSQIRTAYEYNYDRTWNNAYAGGLYDLKLLRQQSIALDAPAYTGIADIMTALYMGLLVDHCGDVPFSEALAGSEDLKPAPCDWPRYLPSRRFQCQCRLSSHRCYDARRLSYVRWDSQQLVRGHHARVSCRS